ncbi:MAG: hypothetical protein AAGB31_06125 [Bdellovibrio sp.]
MKFKAIILLSGFILFSAGTSQASTECGEVMKELKAMQEAQKQMMGSLVSNHESFASSLEEYSLAVGSTGKDAASKLSVKMEEAAESFRQRGLRGQKSANRLNEATEALLGRVAACLK